jgi:integrase
MGEYLDPSWYLIPSRRRVRMADGPDGKAQYRWKISPEVPVSEPEQIVHRALERLDLDGKQEGFHTIRRSVARVMFDTLVEEGGYDSAIRIVQSLLNHASSSMTERYLGVSAERNRRDDILRGAPFLTRSVLAQDVPDIVYSMAAGEIEQ